MRAKVTGHAGRSGNQPLEATVNYWAKSLGKAEPSLRQGLTRAGIQLIAGKKYSAREIYHALTGDKAAAQTRVHIAEAEKLERENKIANGEICLVIDVEKLLWENCLLPLRQMLESLPASMSAQCNPANPELAQTVLQAWVEDVKANIRERAK